MIHPITQFKIEQNQLVTKIKEEHDHYDSYRYRHNHIAYCELRGRTREQIEKPREFNEPNEHLIKQIKQRWQKELDLYNVQVKVEEALNE